MPSPLDPSSKKSELFLLGLSIAVLSVCLYYAFLGLQMPKRNLPWDSDSWVVGRDQVGCTDERRCLFEGDRLLEIDGVSFEAYRRDRTQPILTHPQTTRVRVERGGELLWVDLQWSRRTRVQTLESGVMSLFPLFFWLMGTVASVLVRPRDRRWLVLVAFYYVSALFFASGFISYTQQAWSFYVTHVGAALFLPLTVHLHLLLPNPAYPRLRRTLVPALYVLAAGLIAWDLGFESLDARVLRLLPLAALLLAMVLFVGRLFQRQPVPIRMANRLVATGLFLGATPLILVLLLVPSGMLRHLPYGTDNLLLVGLVALMLPNWPLSYLYAIYKLDLGNIELRANRALATYGFWSLYLSTYIVLFLVAAETWPALADQPILASLLVSLGFVATTPFLRQTFQRFVDRYVFGIHYSPAAIVGLFAERIPLAFEPEILRETLEEVILPTLMIRQSALVFLRPPDRHSEQPQCEILHTLGIEPEDVPADCDVLDSLLEQRSRPSAPARRSVAVEREYPWVRLAIPLRSRGHVVGAWLLGRRDPDDAYPRDDVQMLINLCNQMASLFRTQLELEENQRLQDQLIQSQKMEAIGRLSAGIAHDFNNLLSAILGYSDLLLDRRERRDPMAPRYVQGIKEAGEKAAALTTQLLAFSRQQVMAARVVNLDDVVRHLEALLRRVIEEDILLRTDLAGDLPNVRIDPGQMEQVLLNLAVNSSDAMPDGGSLELSTRAVVCSGDEPFATEIPPGEYVVLRVADTGAGIEPEALDRIFEPFFTTKRLGEGTGLGLAMVYGIVTQSQGHIVVESQPGLGTYFDIYLPSVDEELTETDVREVEERQGAAPDPETVLLVEDEKSVRKVVFEILRSRGYRLLQAGDGVEALELAAEHEGPIDVLLTDVMMPNMKGPELSRRLLETRPEMVVIFMSGYSEDDVLSERVRRGQARLVRKPFTPQGLAQEVRDALDQRAGADGPELPARGP